MDVKNQSFYRYILLQLTFTVDTELFYRDRDREIKKAFQEMGAVTVSKVGHTLYDIDRYLLTAFKKV